MDVLSWDSFDAGTGEPVNERNERFQELLEELLPEVRLRHPTYPPERVFETAIHLAAFRMSGDASSMGVAAVGR